MEPYKRINLHSNLKSKGAGSKSLMRQKTVVFELSSNVKAGHKKIPKKTQTDDDKTWNTSECDTNYVSEFDSYNSEFGFGQIIKSEFISDKSNVLNNYRRLKEKSVSQNKQRTFYIKEQKGHEIKPKGKKTIINRINSPNRKDVINQRNYNKKLTIVNKEEVKVKEVEQGEEDPYISEFKFKNDDASQCVSRLKLKFSEDDKNLSDDTCEEEYKLCSKNSRTELVSKNFDLNIREKEYLKFDLYDKSNSTWDNSSSTRQEYNLDKKLCQPHRKKVRLQGSKSCCENYRKTNYKQKNQIVPSPKSNLVYYNSASTSCSAHEKLHYGQKYHELLYKRLFSKVVKFLSDQDITDNNKSNNQSKDLESDWLNGMVNALISTEDLGEIKVNIGKLMRDIFSAVQLFKKPPLESPLLFIQKPLLTNLISEYLSWIGYNCTQQLFVVEGEKSKPLGRKEMMSTLQVTQDNFIAEANLPLLLEIVHNYSKSIMLQN